MSDDILDNGKIYSVIYKLEVGVKMILNLSICEYKLCRNGDHHGNQFK